MRATHYAIVSIFSLQSLLRIRKLNAVHNLIWHKIQVAHTNLPFILHTHPVWCMLKNVRSKKECLCVYAIQCSSSTLYDPFHAKPSLFRILALLVFHKLLHPIDWWVLCASVNILILSHEPIELAFFALLPVYSINIST